MLCPLNPTYATKQVSSSQEYKKRKYCKLTSIVRSTQSTESISDIGFAQTNEEEAEFKEDIRKLCEDRNIPFERVKNARDLGSISQSPIKTGRAYRMGKVSDATEKDIKILFNDIGKKTLIDLRSPTELREDPE